MVTANTDNYFRVFTIKDIKKISLKELKRRYRKLSLAYHPDIGGDQDKFVFIKEAYDYLEILVKQNINIDNKKFFNNDHLFFYGNGSIYDTKKGRWIKIKV